MFSMLYPRALAAVLSLPLLKQGGLIIFDDYLWTCSKKDIDDPKPAIDAFIDLYADKIKVLFINQQVIIKKIEKLISFYLKIV
jgi:predicted O-methyltransferase YrrM